MFTGSLPYSLNLESVLPSSFVVTFNKELLTLEPTTLLANTLTKYVVQGRRPLREALVKELDITQELLERDPWHNTSLKDV